MPSASFTETVVPLSLVGSGVSLALVVAVEREAPNAETIDSGATAPNCKEAALPFASLAPVVAGLTNWNGTVIV